MTSNASKHSLRPLQGEEERVLGKQFWLSKHLCVLPKDPKEEEEEEGLGKMDEGPCCYRLPIARLY